MAQKTISKQAAERMIAQQSWQYDIGYTIILNRDVATLPELNKDRSYLKKVLERNGWEYVDWGSGNGPGQARFTEMKFRKAGTNCKVDRIYTNKRKMRDGYYHMQLSEKIVFSAFVGIPHR